MKIEIKIEEESPCYKIITRDTELPESYSADELSSNPSKQHNKTGQNTKRDRKNKQYNYSLWKKQENLAYMNFLLTYHIHFTTSSTERRLMKINVMMSKAVKTRSPDQCRSHHQKMMKYHHTISGIVQYIRKFKVPDTAANYHSKMSQVKIEDPENLNRINDKRLF